MGHYVRDITLFNQNISSVYHIIHCTCDLSILGTHMDASVSFLRTDVRHLQTLYGGRELATRAIVNL
jgi:hypothetical protein